MGKSHTWADFDLQGYLEEEYSVCSDIYCGVSVPLDWYPIVIAAIMGIQMEVDTLGVDVKIAQIKEKWGGLRIYYDVCPSEEFDRVYSLVDPIIGEAESQVLALKADASQGKHS